MSELRAMELRGRLVEVQYRRCVQQYGSRETPEYVSNEIVALFVDGQRFNHLKHWRTVDRVMERGR